MKKIKLTPEQQHKISISIELSDLVRRVRNAKRDGYKIKVGETMLRAKAIADELRALGETYQLSDYNELIRVFKMYALEGQLEACAKKYGFPMHIDCK